MTLSVAFVPVFWPPPVIAMSAVCAITGHWHLFSYFRCAYLLPIDTVTHSCQFVLRSKRLPAKQVRLPTDFRSIPSFAFRATFEGAHYAELSNL